MAEGSGRGPVIAVHGGAGVLASLRDDPTEQSRVQEGIGAALRAGQQVLLNGGRAVRAVEQAVRILEDRECFNAGYGSYPTADGRVEMDASIMCGAQGSAGAVAAVTTIVHPVSAARLVMEQGRHVLVIGAAADEMAKAARLEIAPVEFFEAAARRKERARASSGGSGGNTVGAVAMDDNGDLAAATSTGGVPGQSRGRVGDSPILGAGTWAANGRCAVSATGSGELIVRCCVAHEIDALVRLSTLSIEEAARRAVALVESLSGEVGCVAIDANGNVTMPFNTEAMPRGVVRGDREPEVAIYETRLRSQVP